MKRVFALGIVTSVALLSCIETEPVSPVPQIAFESLELFLGYDSLGNLKTISELKFRYVDGDADIGLYLSDTVPDTTGWDERNYNVFLIPYRKINSVYFLIGQDSSNPPPYYKIWHNEKLDRVGQNKTIKGTITITLEDLPREDTIRYDFYIRDRAGNKSNIETTTDLGTRIDPEPF